MQSRTNKGGLLFMNDTSATIVTQKWFFSLSSSFVFARVQLQWTQPGPSWWLSEDSWSLENRVQYLKQAFLTGTSLTRCQWDWLSVATGWFGKCCLFCDWKPCLTKEGRMSGTLSVKVLSVTSCQLLQCFASLSPNFPLTPNSKCLFFLPLEMSLKESNLSTTALQSQFPLGWHTIN